MRAGVAAVKVVETQRLKGAVVALCKVPRHRGGKKWRVAAETASQSVSFFQRSQGV